MEVDRSLSEPSRITRRSRPHRRSCRVCPNPKGEFISNHNPCSMERTRTVGHIFPPSRGQTRDFLWIISSSLYSITFLFTYKVRPAICQLCIMIIIDTFFLWCFSKCSKTLMDVIRVKLTKWKKENGAKVKRTANQRRFIKRYIKITLNLFFVASYTFYVAIQLVISPF